LKVVHVSTEEASGGAARAALRLHDGLRRLGADSTLFVEHRATDGATTRRFEPPRDPLSRVRRRLRGDALQRRFAAYRATRKPGTEIFTDARSRHGHDPLAQLPAADVVNLHWIAQFVDYELVLAPLAATQPVVWTLHDMNAFTGGCHYDLGCRRFLDRCGACPQLGSLAPDDLSSDVLAIKRRVYHGIGAGRIHFVTPSRWLADEVRGSMLGTKFPVSVIPYGLDLDAFAPRDQQAARDTLGIPRGAHVVLFLGHYLANERKGFRLLAGALEPLRVRLPDLFLLSVGIGSVPDVRAPGLHLPHLDHDRLLSLVYSAADVFVIPSRQDNLPNTVLEAMACGTPVVGFAVGGIPDMVRDGETGLLVSPFDVEALGLAIAGVCTDPERRRAMGARCRRVAEEDYRIEQQARRYLDLYRSLLPG
jgi:glycosyltransferase involved in cell wall biosynthesis